VVQSKTFTFSQFKPQLTCLAWRRMRAAVNNLPEIILTQLRDLWPLNWFHPMP